MPTEILMPALSPTMEEGKLAKWLVKEGQQVKAGDIIAEIETDKATMEVEAVDEGKVGQLLVADGHRGRQGQHADRRAAGRRRERRAPPRKPKAPTPQAAATPRAEAPKAAAAASASAASSTSKPAAATAHSSATAGAASAPPAQPTACTSASSPRRWRAGWPRRPASSSARWRARVRTAASSSATSRAHSPTAHAAHGQGRHAGGAKRQHGAHRASASQAMPDDKILALYDKSSYEVVPHDGMRKVIAQRLTLSKQTIPHFYLTVDCRLDELLRARERMNADLAEGRPARLQAVGQRLRHQGHGAGAVSRCRTPTSRGPRPARCATSIPTSASPWPSRAGLFTPIIRHAELKSLSEISNEMKDLAERARKRRLAPHEYQGGTTSISNLGMYGIKSFDAVINPPHATILAVGAGEKRPVVVGDKVEVATIDVLHAVLRPPGGRRRDRGRAAQRLQDADRRPRADAGVSAGLAGLWPGGFPRPLSTEIPYSALVAGCVDPLPAACGCSTIEHKNQ